MPPRRTIGNTVLTFPAREEAENEQEDREVTKRVELPVGAGEESIETLRLDGSGDRTGGSAADSVGEAAAYALRMAELVGELLAVGPPASLELTLAGGAWLVMRGADGGVIVARGGRLTDAAMLRRALAP